MSRAPARKGRQDANHRAIADAIRVLGYPVMDLSAAGNGVEDLLVGLRRRTYEDDEVICFWIVVEAKVSRAKHGGVSRSQFTKAQQEWRAQTGLWPRITAVSAQDAVSQIREMTR